MSRVTSVANQLEASGGFSEELLSAAKGQEHIVQFYDREERLHQAVGDFLAVGLTSGEPCVVFATESHRDAFRRELTSRGVEVDAACDAGLLTLLDARLTLDSFMVAGAPDWSRFSMYVGGLLTKIAARSGGKRIRAYGEMVDLLWREGARASVIRLEEFWNDLGKAQPFSLLCAYLMGNFYKDADRNQFQHICQTHSHVLPSEGYVDSDDPAERLRQVSLLQQRALALQTELKDRQQLEEALRIALEERRRAEEQARTSQKEFQDFLDSAAEGLHWVGPDGKVLWANQAELDLLGYSREEFIGKHISQFHVDQPLIEDMLNRLGRNETLRNCEARLRAKDGSIKHVLITSNVHWRDGQFIHTQCFTRDLTDTIEERRRGAERLRFLAEASELLSSSLDPEKTMDALARVVVPRLADNCVVDFVEADGSVRRVAEASLDPAKEDLLRRLRKFPVGPGRPSPVLKVIETRQTVFIPDFSLLNAKALDPSDEYMDIVRQIAPRSSVTVPLVGRHEVIGAFTFGMADSGRRYSPEDIALAEDIARRATLAIENARLYERERAGAARLRALDDVSKTLSEANLDLQVVLKTVVSQVGTLLGNACTISLIQPDGEHLDIAAIYHSDPDGEKALASLQGTMPVRVGEGLSGSVAKTGETLMVPVISRENILKLVRPEHRSLLERFPVVSLLVVPLAVRGRVIGTLSASRDTPGTPFTLEDKRLLEGIADRAALAIENARLYEDQRRRSEFEQQVIGIVSHDLRNPINAIGMSAALLLKRGQLNEQQGKAVTRIVSSTERANRMIRDFLDFTQARLGDGIPVTCRPLDLHELIQTVVEEIHVSYPERQVELIREGNGEGSWDADRLAQLIGNLVTNAFQHGAPESPIRIVTRGAESTVEVEVVNRGQPIPADKLAELFLPFKRGKEAQQRSSGSIGLGLYIARQLALAHSGNIDAASTSEGATVFTVSLPRHPPCK